MTLSSGAGGFESVQILEPPPTFVQCSPSVLGQGWGGHRWTLTWAGGGGRAGCLLRCPLAKAGQRGGTEPSGHWGKFSKQRKCKDCKVVLQRTQVIGVDWTWGGPEV